MFKLFIKNLFKDRTLTVLHQEARGISFDVTRTWWQYLIFDNKWATTSEMIANAE